MGLRRREKSMDDRKIPTRIEINGKWYDVREACTGKLELYEFMKNPEFTANEPFSHMKNFYHIYHASGGRIGYIHMDNRTYSGAVSNFEG